MTTQTLKLHGLVEPKLLNERERRPVAGLEDRYEITRTGRVWSRHKSNWMLGELEVQLHVDGQKIFAKTTYLVAISWLSEEERTEIRTLLAGVPKAELKQNSLALAPKFSVSCHAIRWIMLMNPSDFVPVQVVHQKYAQILPELPRD